MNVWHLVSNRWNSAISEYAVSAVKAFQLLKYNNLVTPLQGSPLERRLFEAGVTTSAVDHFGPGQFTRLLSLVKNFEPDLIMTYGGPETTAALFLKGLAQKSPKLIRFQGYCGPKQNPVLQVVKRLGHKTVDHFIAPSQYVAESIRGLLSCPVSVVTLGCDSDVFTLKNITRSTRPELLIFGRLDPVKGHREFLPMFQRILALSENEMALRPRLRIVGVAENISKVHIEKSAYDLGIKTDDLIIECGRISNVSELMSSVSLGVVSSLDSEAICRVAEEFLLCGTPIVSTDVGSLKEVFVERQFGFCFGKNSDVDQAQSIFNILKLSHLESADDRRARAALAEKWYSIPAMAAALKDVLSLLQNA